MNIGGGEAADQLVRMMLSFGEVSVRLGGSALKNVLALSLALAKKQKILFSAIHDRDDKGKLIDVILPVTELDRANMIFERVGYLTPESAAPQREQSPPREEREGPQKQLLFTQKSRPYDEDE